MRHDAEKEHSKYVTAVRFSLLSCLRIKSNPEKQEFINLQFNVG